MLKNGFNIADCSMEFKEIEWETIKNVLYTKLNPSQFLQQIDDLHVEMVINNIPSERTQRRRVYDWFEEWIYDQNTRNLEKLLAFISGTTRIPLNRKITIGWRKCSEEQNNIYYKLLYSSTCTCNLILCQDYSSKDEFYECMEICLNNSTEFSETGYRRVIQSIETINPNTNRSNQSNHLTVRPLITPESDVMINPNTADMNSTGSPLIIEQNEQENVNDDDLVVIDLTTSDENNNEKATDKIITIDINSEVEARNNPINRKRRSKRQAKSARKNESTNHDPFIEVTAEEILETQKKPGHSKRTVTTRSQSLAADRSNNSNGSPRSSIRGRGESRSSRGRGTRNK